MPAPRPARRVPFSGPFPWRTVHQSLEGTSTPDSTKAELRQFIHDYTEQKTVGWCRRGKLIVSAKGASYRRACNNAFSCPRCSPHRMRLDYLKISNRIAEAAHVVGITLTVPTGTTEQAVKDLYRVYEKAFTHGRFFTEWRAEHHVVGYVRSLESTFSETTAHPHFHLLVAFDKKPTADTVDALLSQWEHAADRVGIHADRAAQKAQLIPMGPDRDRASWYLTEQDAVRPARPGKGRAPGDLLAGAARGDADDFEALLQWQRATRGKQKVKFSRGDFWKWSLSIIASRGFRY